ncbi:MAG: integrase/recombinase XerD [Solirubrobacteraceae bacterium]|jgi:site-specific recombinase XerD|nr:integrase/recombinase XerD [Solirubrobacteraceae bacterium]
MTTLVAPGRASRRGGGELVDAFDAQALAIAATAAAPNTRRAYATAYRAFAAFLRARYGEASRETITVAAVAAWRDELAAQGLAPSSIAQRVSAVRRLAATLGADALVQHVRCTHIQHDKPRALSDIELERLLRQPDRRATIGVRDRAILELLARGGLRRAELARLTVADIQERGRQPDARRRTAIAPGRAEQTRLEVVVRASKRGRTRAVPLHAKAHDALARWYASRPTSASDALFVSLRQRHSARPEAISASAVGDIVAKHAAGAGVRDDRCTAHALRHTFCTMLAERDVALEVIRELAGHVDVRATQIYVDVTDRRKEDGIAVLERDAHPLAA